MGTGILCSFLEQASGFEMLLLNVYAGGNVGLMNNAAHQGLGPCWLVLSRRLQVTTNGPWANPALPFAALCSWASLSEP